MVIRIRKKQLMIMLFTIVSILTISIINSTFAMQHYYNVDFSTGLVTATTLNVRSGPSTAYKIVATVNKNEYIRVFAGVGEWYIVQVEGDFVGAVSKKYVKPIYPNTDNNNSQGGTSNEENNTNLEQLSKDETETLNLINEQRKKQGLKQLKIDQEVQRVAKIKAQDMVDNNYFSHNSPIYGSPFEMLKNFKISYKTAGENIAGNSNNNGAVNAWMNSSGHKANILNTSFNYTGIGIVSSPKYGKIYVQIFVGK